MPCHKVIQATCGGAFHSEKLRYWANSRELRPANNHVNELRSDVSPHGRQPSQQLGYHLMRDPDPELPAKPLLDSLPSRNCAKQLMLICWQLESAKRGGHCYAAAFLGVEI